MRGPSRSPIQVITLSPVFVSQTGIWLRRARKMVARSFRLRFRQFPASSRSVSTMLVLLWFSTGAPLPSYFPEHVLQRLVLARNSSAFFFPSGFLLHVCQLLVCAEQALFPSLACQQGSPRSLRNSRDLLTNSRSACNRCWLLAAVSRVRLCGCVFLFLGGKSTLAFLNFSSSNLSPISFDVSISKKFFFTKCSQWKVTWFPACLRATFTKKSRQNEIARHFTWRHSSTNPSPTPSPTVWQTSWQTPRRSPAPHAAQALHALWRRREELGAARLPLRVAVFRIIPL